MDNYNGKSFDGVVVKDNYELMMLIKENECGIFSPIKWHHAIIHRKKTDDYVFCSCYNIDDGTWGQGHYCITYEQALNEMCYYIKRHMIREVE